MLAQYLCTFLLGSNASRDRLFAACGGTGSVGQDPTRIGVRCLGVEPYSNAIASSVGRTSHATRDVTVSRGGLGRSMSTASHTSCSVTEPDAMNMNAHRCTDR